MLLFAQENKMVSMAKPIKSKRVIELDSEKAKWYFRDEKNYVNFDLPDYFHFNDLLTIASGILTSNTSRDKLYKKLSNGKNDSPKNYEQVNYTLLGNKDGKFGWRQFQIIHPVLYVDLVNLITNTDNWQIIKNKFKEFNKTCVQCISIPRVSQDGNSHRASQVMHWWEAIEQRSVKMALEYSYVFTTDVANCYPSIYTHSIEWALAQGGREEVKKYRNNSNEPRSPGSVLGAQIDRKIQEMNFGQTNGIPQGSVLMDFIAEIVLGYGDVLLTEILRKEIPPEENFRILRYRDDYRIFVNNPVMGQQILKHLSAVLYGLNMKMNQGKTTENDDIILSSIKSEKLERIATAPVTQHYQKEALRIYQISKKYPNAGIVTKELSLFYDRIFSLKYLKNTDIEVLVAIFCMIALSSPRLINWISAIISHLLSIIGNDTRKKKIVEKIYKKFKDIPNTGFIDIWLQRISAPLGVELSYNDRMTRMALEALPNSSIWECSWLNADVVALLDVAQVSDLDTKIKTGSLPPVIQRREVELFKLNYD